MQRYDVAVVGAGIVGLAHAWMAVRRGLHVLLVDRNSQAQGATVRNFGMIWPIGQPAGELHAVAQRSRELWLELAVSGVVNLETCGSIHVAHREDEFAVLREFVELGSHPVEMLSASQVLERCPLVSPQGLYGGMWSSSELRVDPRRAAARIATWLAEQPNVTIAFDTAITSVQENQLRSSDGRCWQAERIVICSGSDLQTLYPAVLQSAGLRLCKLQMLQISGEPTTSPMPHIASGLTLRHYNAFGACPSLPQLQQRIATETPELDRYGIHVMASAMPDGRIILGDSHEYDREISPFDSSLIDDLMIRELRKILQLADWKVEQRWHGIYAKHGKLPVVEASLPNGVTVFVGTGGAGMTMSFGLADRAWKQWDEKSE
jgi:D-hydroxyproline dehydrogenase subunit beta